MKYFLSVSSADLVGNHLRCIHARGCRVQRPGAKIPHTPRDELWCPWMLHPDLSSNLDALSKPLFELEQYVCVRTSSHRPKLLFFSVPWRCHTRAQFLKGKKTLIITCVSGQFFSAISLTGRQRLRHLYGRHAVKRDSFCVTKRSTFLSFTSIYDWVHSCVCLKL